MNTNVNEQERCLAESIKELECVNKKLAKLLVRREELTADIIGALDHEHAGQRTYEYDIWKITCKTPNTYSLNTKLYKSGDIYLEPEFNPIKESVTYTVDKSLFDKYYSTAPEATRESLLELVTVKPGKESVSIEARV